MKRKYTQEEIEQRICCGFYFNPHDLNIIVCKRRYAWTLNMGNKWSWVITAGVVLLVIGVNLLMKTAVSFK